MLVRAGFGRFLASKPKPRKAEKLTKLSVGFGSFFANKREQNYVGFRSGALVARRKPETTDRRKRLSVFGSKH